MSSSNGEGEKPYEAVLTIEEYKYLQSLLPKGFAQIQPSKHNSNNNVIRGLSKIPMKISNSNTDNSHLVESNSQRREHRSSRVVRNMDHEMPYTTQKLPKNVVDSLKKCKNIITALKKHRSAEPFLRAVEPTLLKCPDYFDIIKEPMDLGTVERKLRNNSYTTPSQFFDDVRKIWSNAFTYNPRNSQVYNMTYDISQYFEELYKQMEMPLHEENQSMLENKVQRLEKKLSELNQRKYPSKTGQNTGTSNDGQSVNMLEKNLSKQGSIGAQSPNAVYEGSNRPGSSLGNKDGLDKPMSFHEKKSLTMMIKNLPTSHLKGVWQIVCNDNPSQSMKKELVIDIERLPTRTARELEKYVKGKLLPNQKTNKKKQKKNQLGFIDTGDAGNNNENYISENNIGQQSMGGTNLGYSEDINQANNYDQYQANQQEQKLPTQQVQQNQLNVDTQVQEHADHDQSSDSSFFTDLDSDEEK